MFFWAGIFLLNILCINNLQAQGAALFPELSFRAGAALPYSRLAGLLDRPDSLGSAGIGAEGELMLAQRFYRYPIFSANLSVSGTFFPHKNKAVRETFGYTADELSGETLRLLTVMPGIAAEFGNRLRASVGLNAGLMLVGRGRYFRIDYPSGNPAQVTRYNTWDIKTVTGLAIRPSVQAIYRVTQRFHLSLSCNAYWGKAKRLATLRTETVYGGGINNTVTDTRSVALEQQLAWVSVCLGIRYCFYGGI